MTDTADITIAQLPEKVIAHLAGRIFDADPEAAGLAPVSQGELAHLAAGGDRAKLTPVIAWIPENLDRLGGDYPGEPPPFDHLQSYWDNFYRGPRETSSVSVLEHRRAPTSEFLGFELGIPFGVPACAVTPHSGYVEYFARRGFDLVTYKTVRAGPWDPYLSPNLAFATDVREPLGVASLKQPIHPTLYPDQLPSVSEASFVNSIGVPSLPTERWAADIARTRGLLARGQLLIVSVMGSPELLGEGDERGLIGQFVDVAAAAKDAGAPVVELNLSCPNTGGDLVCRDAALAGRICAAVRRAIGDTPLLIKISHMADDALADLVRACKAHMNGIVAINAVQVHTQDVDGKPFFGGRSNDFAGLSGVGIRDLGLTVTRSLSRLRGDEGPAPEEWVIVGIGGVNCPADFQAYVDAGADAVQSCTGSWLNNRLALQIREHLGRGHRDRRRFRDLMHESFEGYRTGGVSLLTRPTSDPRADC